jgi:hypothetical protein
VASPRRRRSNRRQNLRRGMALYVNGAWSGWKGNTIVRLTDGSAWRQVEYYYQYRFSYRPRVEISQGKMHVEGMNRAVCVRRV